MSGYSSEKLVQCIYAKDGYIVDMLYDDMIECWMLDVGSR